MSLYNRRKFLFWESNLKLAATFLVVIIMVLGPFFYVVGLNPLWYFVSNRAYVLTTFSLKLGVNPNSCENRGRDCPLFIAAVYEDMKMIKILERYGGDMRILNKNHENVLNVQCANIGLLNFFIDKGADINNQSFDRQGKLGFTPLHCAVLNNKPEAVKLLISKGADKAKTLSGWAGKKNVTPLQLAQLKNLSDIIPLLK